MEKIGRNDPCHCGSGKKYKNCHMKNESSGKGMNKAFILTGIFVALITIGVVGYIVNSNRSAEVQTTGFKPGPPPAGEPPAGKVWSYEHGHWHDAR